MSLPEKSNTKARLAILFAVPLAFSLLFFLVNVAAEHNDTRLLRLENLVSRVAVFRSVANDAEVGEHGFLLTGDERYLTILESANTRVVTEASALTGNDAEADVQQQISGLVSLIKHRLAAANHVIDVQRANGFQAALQVAKSDDAQETMNQIRRKVDLVENQLNHQTAKYLDEERYLTHWAFLFFLIGMLVMLVVLVWLYNSFVSYIQARDSAESQLKALNAELERRIDERTKELQHFNEELQQFAYVASHDLQEPLRTITSFTQLLASRYKGRLDEDADEFIGYIVSSSRRMTDLINGLLAVVRLRKAGQTRNPVSFDELVEQARVSLQALIRENEAEIDTASLPSLIVDQVQFAQVFQNLISNAIKYRSEQSPRIRIEARRDGSNWVFCISDNGRGFDQQFADRVFGLFQRLHGREVEGTGMGLSIARRIVERHGGRMWAESKEGEGSKFYFSLPVSLQARAKDQPEAVVVGEAG
ncbi:MAG: CHASE3 domain-containing protein [Acidobacteriaceae bacterium]|nr:CHASE3 domain-containing protein [Acidobacteriaceae bacterium]